MNILAIDTSTATLSVALLKDNAIKCEYNISNRKTHTNLLLPIISEILSMHSTAVEDLQAIAYTDGFGSYTGVRIGKATAFGLSVAHNVELVEIQTLYALAYPHFGYGGTVAPLIDARNKRVYCAQYLRGEQIGDAEALPLEEFMAKLPPGEVLFTGDGAAKYKQDILEIREGAAFAPIDNSFIKAGTVAVIASEKLNK